MYTTKFKGLGLSIYLKSNSNNSNNMFSNV